ncbi:cysteine-rich motor neuron 1 protein-like isoform X2 [Pollicipes pollicipes]|uniref:cysteine-rich motor neuron 1 protein-like isoform X2 n=1 Tax=Pollicipes pollicipes TaxID=41117 RepID=UPI0018858DA1|nr:cysteine-rich motor neuron 1 protein-like isoform X2 [Pollicipes pollicipes]
MTGPSLTALMLLSGLTLSAALSCTPCEKTTCVEVSCPGRTVRDVCGCCDVCARGLGERCGGYFDSFGLCDDGLVCQTSPRHGQPVDTGAEGVCTKNATACKYSLCQLMLGTQCVCTELEDCRSPDVSGDPTSFTSREECEKAASRNQAAPASEPTPAEVPNCPGVVCEPGVSTCPADSVLKTAPAENPDCCPPVGTCLCDLESCAVAPSCPEGQEATQVTKGQLRPGLCCSQWECKPTAPQTNLSCSHDGREYGPGERWQPARCKSCQCKDGLAFCHPFECPAPADCDKVTQDVRQCCPQCIDGCVSQSGVRHNSSEQWLEDDCTTCSCVGRMARCHVEMCHISCSHHRSVPGRCCPVCDECDVMCQHGYRTSRDGEPLCECLTADEVGTAPAGCRSMAACRKACPHGFKVDDNGCERCKCKKCRKLKDCTKKCPHGFMTNDRACAICKCRSEPEDGRSVALAGHEAADMDCVTLDGVTHEEGEQWHDGCRQCYCHGGEEMCAVISCPVPRCDQPEIADGQCCPTCPGGTEHPAQLNGTVCQSVNGQTYVEGQTWQLDPCTRCLCHAGRVLCSAPPCPPAPCAEPTRHLEECCATCASTAGHQTARGECTDASGVVRAEGDAWRQGTCTSCVCRQGKVSCFHEKCPLLDCVRPVLKKSHCCPVCLEPAQSFDCVYENRTMASGQTWEVGKCTSCVCQRGQTVCTHKTCTVVCDSPVMEPGQCCPTCKEETSAQRNFHLLSGVSKATHRTVVRTPEGPTQTSHHGVEREPGEQQSSSYIVLCVVIGFLLLLLLAVFVFWCVRRQRSGYSPKHMIEEKKPLNDPQIMHFVRLDGRGLHSDALILEKNGTVVRDV